MFWGVCCAMRKTGKHCNWPVFAFNQLVLYQFSSPLVFLAGFSRKKTNQPTPNTKPHLRFTKKCISNIFWLHLFSRRHGPEMLELTLEKQVETSNVSTGCLGWRRCTNPPRSFTITGSPYATMAFQWGALSWVWVYMGGSKNRGTPKWMV